MIEKVKSCPFCGEPPQVRVEEGKTSIAMHACRILDKELRMPLHIWNTRRGDATKAEAIGGVLDTIVEFSKTNSGYRSLIATFDCDDDKGYSTLLEHSVVEVSNLCYDAQTFRDRNGR